MRVAFTVTVIMPVYNGEDFIALSLPPLIKMQQAGEIIEVIVVDDSSTDSSAIIAKELGACIIPSGGRLGPGAARNLAAKQAKGDILWFVDADVVVHENAARQLITGFTLPEVVAVFGCYDDHPVAQNFLSQYKNLVHHYYHSHTNTEASTFWSGCGAVRKQAFLQAGGFDIDLYKRPSIEDIELGYRLKNAGWRILLIPELLSTHLKEWRFINLLHTEIFCRAIPWSRLLLNRTGLHNDLNVTAGERARAGLAGLLLICILVTLFGILPIWGLAIVISAVFLVNRELFLLFSKRKGLWFGISATLFHQLYYLYSATAFVWCWFEIKIFNK